MIKVKIYNRQTRSYYKPHTRRASTLSPHTIEVEREDGTWSPLEAWESIETMLVPNDWEWVSWDRKQWEMLV